MYKFMQKNKKKLLAVFGAFLMIVFILPSTMNQGSFADPVEATIDGQDVHATEFQQAMQELEILNKLTMGQNQWQSMPLIYNFLPQPAIQQMETKPELFLLLKKEAEKMGVVASSDQLNNILTNSTAAGLPPRDQQVAQRAVENMLKIQGAFDRMTSALKPTEPQRQRLIAEALQEIKVRYVAFTADSFASQATAPTPEQLKAHFEKFKDVAPEADAEKNPFGFGYRYPNRVKLQYLMIPREDVKKAIAATRDEYAWDVEAQKHYLKNPGLYQGVEEASTPPTTEPTTAPAAEAKPTTKPFETVRSEIVNRLQEEETEQRMQAIQSRVNSMLIADFNAYRNSASANTMTTTQPTTQGAAAYPTHEYLQRVAAQIQQQFGVLLSITSLAERWHSEKDLVDNAYIGTLSLDGYPLAGYLTQQIAPFAKEDESQRRGQPPLALLEPSRPILDGAGNVYIVRVTEAEAAHAAATFAEIEERVQKDWIKQQGYELALAAARKLEQSAAQTGLVQASSDRPPLTTDYFARGGDPKLEGVALEDASRSVFNEGAFQLLYTPKAASGERIRTVELPSAGAAVVVELDGVRRTAEDVPNHVASSVASQRLWESAMQTFATSWYDYDRVVERLNYKPLGQKQEEEAGKSS